MITVAAGANNGIEGDDHQGMANGLACFIFDKKGSQAAYMVACSRKRADLAPPLLPKSPKAVHQQECGRVLPSAVPGLRGVVVCQEPLQPLLRMIILT